MKIFYFFGEETYLIENEIQNIINNNPEAKIVKFDFDYRLNDVLNEISTFSIFDPAKVIIFNNFPLLNKKNDLETKAIINAINFMPISTTLIFVQDNKNEKATSNKLLTFLKKNAECKEFKKLNDREITKFAKNKIHELGGTISEIDLFYLLSKIPNKISVIINEIEKLVLLDKNISRSSIDDLIPKYDLNNVFDFINAFHNRDIESMFKIYYEKINQGETIQNLIGQISSILEMCSKIHSYKMAKYNNNEIAEELKKHPYVIKKNEEFLNSITYNKIEKYLKEIAELDANIKKGLVDEKFGFERFLLEIIR